MIIIHTGTNEVQLRANSVAEKIEWVNALKREQDDCMAGPTKTFDHFKKINETLADLWVCQAACMLPLPNISRGNLEYFGSQIGEATQ